MTGTPIAGVDQLGDVLARVAQLVLPDDKVAGVRLRRGAGRRLGDGITPARGVTCRFPTGSTAGFVSPSVAGLEAPFDKMRPNPP